MDELNNSEPLSEKEDEKENSANNQPANEKSEHTEDKTPDKTPAETTEYVPKAQYDELEDRYRESSSEAIIWRDKANQAQSRRELTNEPTDAELRAAFPSWDTYTESEKEIARGQVATRRMSEAALRAQREREEQERFDRELEIAITFNPSLEGKERAFKEFATKPTHRGTSTDVLVDAFLHRSGTVATPKREPSPGLETGSGGPKVAAKPKTLSGDELKLLRETDYKAYHEYIRTHDIEI